MWTPNSDLPNLCPCYALSIFSLVDCPQLTLRPLLYYLVSFTSFFFFLLKMGFMWVLKNVKSTSTFLKHSHENISTLELPLNSSSFFTFCGFDVKWVENWRNGIKKKNVGRVGEYKAKIICRCQSRSLGLFFMEKHTDCSRNVDKPNLKDLKQCLQNLFLKEKKEM